MTDGLLARAMTVTEAVVSAGEPIGPRSLARATGIDRSAVMRILKQLTVIGVLVSDEGVYRPGPRLFAVSRVLSALDSLPAAANATLRDLVTVFDETCYVCTWHEDSAVFLYEGKSSKPLRYVVELGRPVPLHAGAAGRAILCGLSEHGVRELLGRHPLTALTEGTITDVDALMVQRERDLGCGYSISVQERVDGGFAVAAPFFGSTDECQGSVVLSAPLSRLVLYEVEQVGLAVRHAADALSARLGATRPPFTETQS